MRSAIGWSYALLAPAEQRLFWALAVFVGGVTLDAAAAVAVDIGEEDLAILDGVASLIDKGLVRRMNGSAGEPRFTMLETIREFGLERLAASGVEPETRRRHAEYLLQLVEQLDAFWAPYLSNAQQLLDRLDMEYPNLRAALSWLRETGDVALLLELAGALCYFWQLRGHIREGREWLEWGLRHARDVPLRARAAAQLALAGILYQQAEFGRTLELCDEAIGAFAAADDAVGVVLACRSAAPAAYNSGQLDRAAAYVEHALATLATAETQPWLARLVSDVEFQRGVIAFVAGQFATAERLLSQTVAVQRTLAQETGAELPYACWPLYILGKANSVMGHNALALDRFQAALAHARKFQEQECVVAALTSVARILAVEGRWQESARLFGAAEVFCEQCGYPFQKRAWQWQRVDGLPEPWQRGDEPFGEWETLRATIAASRPSLVPPLPDPSAAAEHWAAGRGIPIEEVVGYALAVDLATPPADVSTVADGPAGTARRSLSTRE